MLLQGKRKQLWVPLLEKAVAKLYGSYSHIQGGTNSFGLKLFTGYAVEMSHMGMSGLYTLL